MIWRNASHFLVQQGNAFVLVDRSGGITKRLAPSTWSIEDELGRISFEVIGDRLLERTRIERWAVTTAPTEEDEVVVEGLVPDATPETAHFIAVALGDDAVVREEHRLQAEREADARIDAIDGARANFRRPGTFVRAQAALCDRIARYADTDAVTLLRTLIALARADVHAPAIEAYAIGCALACFDDNVPALPEADPVASPALAEELAVRAAELDQRSEWQMWVDANMNAAQYARAADAVRHAAKLLGHCSTTGD